MLVGIALADGDKHGYAIIKEVARRSAGQIALSAGLRLASGDAVVTMDSDLQHPPELIGSLLAKAAEGYDVLVQMDCDFSHDPSDVPRRWACSR